MMLVLSRFKDEKIVVGDWEIVITVVEVAGDKVRLGVDADPEKWTVHREEVLKRIERERAEGAE